MNCRICITIKILKNSIHNMLMMNLFILRFYSKKVKSNKKTGFCKRPMAYDTFTHNSLRFCEFLRSLEKLRSTYMHNAAKIQCLGVLLRTGATSCRGNAAVDRPQVYNIFLSPA